MIIDYVFGSTQYNISKILVDKYGDQIASNVLESQKRANYVNQYDRLMGVLGSWLVKDAPSNTYKSKNGAFKIISV